ncbi:hypothetical protein RN001_000026 [Aquatica leii]|uniref:Uncharacterized protein n=1 Tax=Aquatica leii TaxID=1421715 RepID=A0AAN7SSD3_9COLE|nr:hypothetical protein RN001_000026 [Aquatica leii]
MYPYTFYCVLLFCCTRALSAEIPDDLLDKPILECLEKTNMDKLFFKNSFDKKFHLVKGDAKLAESLECLGKSKKLINEDGKLNHDNIHNHTVNILIPLTNTNGDKDQMATKVTNECINVSGDSYSDRIANLHNCIVDALAKHSK